MSIDEGELCWTCGHGEARHQGGAACIECRCPEFAYPNDDEDEA